MLPSHTTMHPVLTDFFRRVCIRREERLLFKFKYITNQMQQFFSLLS